MAIDDERREIARRLRWPEDQGDELCRIICDAVFGDHECHFTECGDCEELIRNRLADLIEPSCDRDVLLVLADEMDEVAQHRRSMGYEGFAIGDKYRARLIRKALGVDE